MFQEHNHILEYADDYFHDILSSEDVAYVAQHCEQCPICQVALEEARKRHQAMQILPRCEASTQLIQATQAKVVHFAQKQRILRRRLLWIVPSVTAAVVLVLGAFHLYYENLTASPFELQVFGQQELLAGSLGSLRVRVLDHPRSAALQGVPVKIELRNASHDWFQLASFQTDAQGSGQPRFQLPDWPDGSCELRVVARPASAEESTTQTIRLKRSWKVMLSSDKPIYQPGQTIHVRGLALRRPDLKPVTGQEVVFSITDFKGNIIFKQRGVTSPFGLSHCDCPLAAEIMEGKYTVICKVGDTESKRTVDVFKYVLPKFKIDAELDQPYYRPGQKVRAKVAADYFFGEPVAGGKIEFEVRTGSGTFTRVEKTGSVQADQQGKGEFDFQLPATMIGTEQDSGGARVGVRVTVTDSAGQKQSRSLTRLVTNNPIHIEVIPEAGTLVRDLPNTIYLYVSHADGRPAAKARVIVSGIEKEIVANELGVASFELTPETDEVSLTVRARDDADHQGSRTVRLPCGQTGGDFLVRTDKAVYEGGETMHLVALGGGTEPVFVDLIKDGQTMLTEVVPVADGRGAYQFDLPAELCGTIELNAYRFNSSGLPVRKSRTLFVRQSRELSIQAAFDHAEYKPGGQARLRLSLTDAKGTPTAGALSLAAVDEAVFAVLEEAPGMERTFYLLEQELLKPVYAIYQWMPGEMPPTDDRRLFEQALFARTAKTDASLRSFTFPINEPGPSFTGFRPVQATLASPVKSPYSLTASSYPTKVRQVNVARQSGLQWVNTSWSLLAFAFIATGFISLCVGLASATTKRIRPTLFDEIDTEGTSSGLSLITCATVFAFFIIICLVSITALGTSASKTFSAVATTISAGGNFKSSPAERAMTKSAVFSESPQTAVPQKTSGETPAEKPVRVREFFPETLLWRPEIITDEKGHASIDVELADSITTWRLLASAVSADGRLGALQSAIKVFQPFFVEMNLPVALTRGDEVALPIVVYNYLDQPQLVELKLDEADWFERLDQADQRLELKPREVRAASYRIRVRKVGNHALQVTARAKDAADAVKRMIEVVPDGQRVEQVLNGNLQQPAELKLTVPENAIEGSPQAILKIYPSSFSQLVEGLDSIFRMPYGCFEQTSSTTYPNILALDYLRRTSKTVPAVEAKARQFIHLGYQRLLTFEVPGGGFEWYGHPPAHVTMSAYGLLEFEDMAKVYDIDRQILERTRRWLRSKQNADGSWSPDSRMMHIISAPGQRGDLATTAYVAWAVFAGQPIDAAAQKTREYLCSQRAETIDNPYVLALVCHALLALDSTGSDARPYVQRLLLMKRLDADGKRVWWEQPPAAYTNFYGAGTAGQVETTALAVLALLAAKDEPATIRSALTWIIEHKDAHGTWHSTQATVLALKALVSATGQPLGKEEERVIEISVDNQLVERLALPPDQADVMRQVSLSNLLAPGIRNVSVVERTQSAAGYQLAFRYHVPDGVRPKASEPLTIRLEYDQTELRVNDTLIANATIENRMTTAAAMVMVDLPIPPGFAVKTEAFDALVKSNSIARYQMTPRQVLVYLRGLEPGKPLVIRYSLQATMPLKATIPPARVYEYYDTDKEGRSSAAKVNVAAR